MARSGAARRAVAAVLLLALAGVACADTALFLDAQRGRYLRAGAPDLALSAVAHAAATAALLRVEPAQAVDAEAAAQVNALLSPNVLDRPAALLSVQLPGVPAGASVASATFGSAAVSTRDLTGGSAAVAAVLAPLPGTPLPATCAAPCDAACLAAALGAPLPAALPLDDPAIAALVAELGCFVAGARAAAADPAAALITARLSAYAAVARAHAAGSDAEAAAAELLAAALSVALAHLQAARGGAAAAHVVLLTDDVAAAELPARRRTLLATGAVRDVNAWYAKVAAFGVGVLLLVAAVGTIIALCTLPTGTDTLLYARTKAE